MKWIFNDSYLKSLYLISTGHTDDLRGISQSQDTVCNLLIMSCIGISSDDDDITSIIKEPSYGVISGK